MAGIAFCIGGTLLISKKEEKTDPDVSSYRLKKTTMGASNWVAGGFFPHLYIDACCF